MGEKPGAGALGALRGTHATNNRRRGWTAAILLPVGVLLVVCSVVFWVFVDDVSGKKPSTGGDPLVLPSVAVGLSLGVLLSGVWLGIWFLTRRGEVFELHDNGVRYSRVGRSQDITWADVDRVVIRNGKDNDLVRWAGGDISCTVHLAGGGKLLITGLTRDAAQLIGRIEAATTR